MTDFLASLPANIRTIAEKSTLSTPEEILLAPKSKFKPGQGVMQVPACTEYDVRVLKLAAAKLVAERPLPVSQLLKPPAKGKWARISFGCSALDRCTGGGIVTRGITEICGAAGTGKTQLLLQLSLAVQLPPSLGGLGRGVAYICTESRFPSKRILEMSKAFAARYSTVDVNYMGNIYIEHLIESNELLKCVSERLLHLMRNISIGLIVIDSVAAIFRLYNNYIERARDMRKLANYLLSYADKYNCAVICVNHVATVSDLDTEVPCLGLSWAHLGRTRIRISRVPKQVKNNDTLLTVRKLEIMYSPQTPNEFAEFLITREGVVNVP